MFIATTLNRINLGNLGQHARLGLLGLCACLMIACTPSGEAARVKHGPDAGGAPIGARTLVDAPIAVTSLAAPGTVVAVPITTDPAGGTSAVKTDAPPRNPRSNDETRPAPPEPAAAKAAIETLEDLSPQAAACRKKGKTWGDAGNQGAKACISQTGDAGKSCKSGKDCEGFCLARSGTCAPFTPLFGCNDILQDDGVEVTICLD